MNTGPGLFTVFHTIVSLAAMIMGVFAIRLAIPQRPFSFSVTVFLGLSAVTTFTGFLFPIRGPTPALVVGVIATLVFAWTIVAGRSATRRRRTFQFMIGLVIGEFLLWFVFIAQLFAKLPVLKGIPLATRNSAFAATELCVLVAFVLVGIRKVAASKAKTIA